MVSLVEVLLTLNHSLSFWIGLGGNLMLIVLCIFMRFRSKQKLKVAVRVQAIYCLFFVIAYALLQLSLVSSNDHTVIIAITGSIIKLPAWVSSWMCYAFHFFYIFDVSTIHIALSYHYTRLYRKSWLNNVYRDRYIPILYFLFAIYTLIIEYFGISLTSFVLEQDVRTVLGTVDSAIVIYNFTPLYWKTLNYVLLFLLSVSFSSALVVLVGCSLIRKIKSHKKLLESEILHRRCTVLLFAQAALSLVTVMMLLLSYFLSKYLPGKYASHTLLLKRLAVELMYWPPAIYPLISIFFLRTVYEKVHNYRQQDEQNDIITGVNHLEISEKHVEAVDKVVSATAGKRLSDDISFELKEICSNVVKDRY